MIFKKKSAFTMVEILIVLGIIVFLFGIFLGPTLVKNLRQSTVKKNQLKMENIKNALMLYKNDMGHFPTKKEGGVRALLERPNVPGSEKWASKYLENEDELIDVWEVPFEYNAPPVKYKQQFHYYEIISVGRVEKEQGEEMFTGQ